MASLKWFETAPGLYKPGQVVQGQPLPVPLDFATFFTSFYRRDPTTIYVHSPFVSAINTVAARQQVVNDLYRIMKVTGYPRIHIEVLEQVIRDKAPAAIKTDEAKMRLYVAAAVEDLSAQFASLRADQAVTHTDSVKISILNEKNPSMGMDVTSIIETLNAQNQAALKSMSTILGRGASGANTGTVEARLAALFADELNEPVMELLEKIFSYILQTQGFQGFAVVEFRQAEMRPATELEPQLLLRSQRLRQDLSDGILSDEEYTLAMYNRLPNPGAPPMSGTGFANPQDPVAPGDVTTGNNDPLGKSVASKATKTTKANTVAKPKKQITAPSRQPAK